MEKKFIESGGEYRKCLASSLFEVKGNPQLDKDSFTFSKDSKYPYFTRTVFNNGILGYVDYLDEEHLIKGNSLAVGMMGMRFFYMNHDFYAGQFTKTAFPIFDGFNESVALWFISWFNKSSLNYLGLLVRDFENAFKNTELIVPYKDGKVAVDYIESRIRELEESRIRELEAYLIAAGFEDCALTQSERDALRCINNGQKQMGRFKIVDEFSVANSHNILKSDVVFGSGSTPYVTASEGNNSIVSYISYKPDVIEQGNSIMIGGKTLVVTYQPDDFFSNDSHNLVLTINHEEGRNESSQLFMVAALYKSLSPKYSWGDSISKAKIQSDEVFMPVNEDGAIDFNFMVTYINAIKKQCIAALKNEIDREHEAYERAINTEQTAMQIPIVRNYDEVEFESFLAAEPFECYKWNRFDKDIIDFFGGNKTILVGCSKNKKHLEWIISHNLYNVRLGDTKGSVAEFRNMFDRTSLLLLYDFKRPYQIFAYAIIAHREMSKQELTQIGYPNPQRKSYMTFQICPIEMDLTLIKNQRLIEKLIEMNPPKDKGTPVFIEP